MADISYKVYPTTKWTVREFEVPNQTYKVGIAIYPEFIKWYPTTPLDDTILFADVNNKRFNYSQSKYRIVFFQSFAVDLNAYMAAITGGKATDYRSFGQTTDTQRVVMEGIGVTYAPGNRVWYLADESKFPFKAPTDSEMGKVEGLTTGYYPSTGFLPSDVLEIPENVWSPYNTAHPGSSPLLSGTLWDLDRELAFTSGKVYKLPPLFTPIIGNRTVSYVSNICVTYLGIEEIPK